MNTDFSSHLEDCDSFEVSVFNGTPILEIRDRNGASRLGIWFF